MDELVKRARASMTLALLASLIVAWSALKKAPSALDSAMRIHDLVASLDNRESLPFINNFVLETAARSDGEGINAGLARIPASLVLAVREDNLTQAFGIETSSGLPNEDLASARQKMFMRLAQEDDEQKLEELMHPFRDILVTPKEVALRSELSHFSALVEQSGLARSANLEQVDSQLKTTIELPVLKEDVETGLAIVLMAVFGLGPLLYFSSICAAMKQQLSTATAAKTSCSCILGSSDRSLAIQCCGLHF